MRIALIGHSSIHIRQQFFAQEIARQGNEVLQICPQKWGNMEAQSQTVESWELLALPHVGDNIYNITFPVVELLRALWKFQPDWIYLQQEPGSTLANLMQFYALDVNAKCALFTWENMSLKGGIAALQEYDLVICGNNKAQELVKSYAKRTTILPQVGIDTDLFKPMPEIKKTVEVGFVGRNVPEKGIPQLMEAWPEAKQMPWESTYLRMPEIYNKAGLLVCFSQDTDTWQEQAMPYVAIESMACGTPVIVSDSGSIPFWHKRYAGTCPGSVVVPKESITLLGHTIEFYLKDLERLENAGKVASLWVHNNFSNAVVAKKLLGAFSE